MSSRTDEAGEGRLIRVSDRERDLAVELLGEHAKLGRLEPDELAARTGWARSTRIRAGLDTLFADLPLPHPDYDALAKPESNWWDEQDDGLVATPTSSALSTFAILTFLLGLPGSIVLAVHTEIWWPIVAVVITAIAVGGLSERFKKPALRNASGHPVDISVISNA
ncbi:hypothetical protein [Alloactinosynnema sp. L-07]|uniref:DUF1707 SHOCT-like domain-containing protein n=1 Tax=Alloactinosynnema sp. L-07 TaxID=1653480 RepID=UPI00065EFF50|nr:DUF1707 domain-containing protein [Alloactinosynnema sp. L-07]CRK59800.1 hypothetical protein [Alloactinosynnema sp. L-07]